jgi:hypothetical protein
MLTIKKAPKWVTWQIEIKSKAQKMKMPKVPYRTLGYMSLVWVACELWHHVSFTFHM